MVKSIAVTLVCSHWRVPTVVAEVVCILRVSLLMVVAISWPVSADVDASQENAFPPLVFADGEGLPAGSGDVATGAAIYADSCAACHGGEGQGGSAIELVGDRDLLATEYPDRGIAVIWPYAPPLFDYVRRAMPPDAPWSLTADETYAVVAHLLDINGLLSPETSQVDAAYLSNLVMPNRDGFIDAR